MNTDDLKSVSQMLAEDTVICHLDQKTDQIQLCKSKAFDAATALVDIYRWVKRIAATTSPVFTTELICTKDKQLHAKITCAIKIDWLLLFRSSQLIRSYYAAHELDALLQCWFRVYDKHHIGDWMDGIQDLRDGCAQQAISKLHSFIEAFREDVKKPWVQKQIKCTRKTIYKRQQSIAQLVDGVFAQHSKVLVLRVDLYYHQQCTDTPFDFEADVTYERAMADLDRLLNGRRHNHLFKHLLGYCWKLEKQTSWHFHTVWFFNGHEHHKDWILANRMIDQWVKVTQGRGFGFNCNQKKSSYKRIGIGLIQRQDMTTRHHLLQALSYLCKKDGIAKPQTPQNRRAFGRSVVR
ncbi:hypothetical protein CUZ56_01199 [Saezia sanguinis]|uniref:YagK/YfjJ C-terminal domain-containing protein n=1 Tax=Saezia sanguinis TaxID=1965230 RepID=A0A433SEY4_9BURK|nr:inovirus-type Gp2 protein [Saezia sanguinis]RUS67256.1 hypothetical protein CUZ56_01199 [Saezia sanguinis]